MQMTCRDVHKWMTPFLRGELHTEERFAVHRHVAGCADCAIAVEETRDAFEMMRTACAGECDPVAEEVPELLIRAIWATTHAPR